MAVQHRVRRGLFATTLNITTAVETLLTGMSVCVRLQDHKHYMPTSKTSAPASTRGLHSRASHTYLCTDRRTTCRPTVTVLEGKFSLEEHLGRIFDKAAGQQGTAAQKCWTGPPTPPPLPQPPLPFPPATLSPLSSPCCRVYMTISVFVWACQSHVRLCM